MLFRSESWTVKKADLLQNGLVGSPCSPRDSQESSPTLQFKSKDITLPTKVCLVKAMVFPVVMYGCESWTVKKADLLQNGLVGSPRSPRDSQQSSPTPQFKSISSLALSFLHSPTLISIHDHWKNHSLDYTDICW